MCSKLFIMFYDFDFVNVQEADSEVHFRTFCRYAFLFYCVDNKKPKREAKERSITYGKMYRNLQKKLFQNFQFSNRS